MSIVRGWKLNPDLSVTLGVSLRTAEDSSLLELKLSCIGLMIELANTLLPPTIPFNADILILGRNPGANHLGVGIVTLTVVEVL
jgi:hypothetical protein